VFRRLIRESAIYAGAGLFGQAMLFVLFPFLAHTLSPRDYGVIDIVGVLTSLAFLTVALEINQGLGRILIRTEEAEERSLYASTALIWSIASYTLLVVVGLVFAGPLTHALLAPRVDVQVLRVALGTIWFGGALYLIQDQLRWLMRPAAFAAVSVVVAVTTAGATAVYVFVLRGGALGVVAGQLTACAVGLGVAAALSPRIYRLRFQWSKARSMLAYSIPLVPSSLGVLLNSYADRLALQHERSLAAVGVYGIGFRIAVVMTVLLMGVQGSMTPNVVAAHDHPETPRDIARVFRMFWALGCVAFIFLSLLAEPLVRLLSAAAYFGAARVVPFLVAATFLAGLNVFAPGPAVAGRTRGIAVANVVAGLLNLGLAFALVPSLGVRGAGLATLLSSAVGFLATMYVSHRLYPVPHYWRRLLSAAVVAVIAVLVTRTMFVSDRATSLHVTSLAVRLGVSLCASLLVAAIAVEPDALRRISLRARATQA
jgi:O-antigen/teichoic acid export membrane protein